MADDAILRETKSSIDRLFAQVSGSAGSASSGLYEVSSASKRASSGLSSLASGTGEASRAAGSFVTAVRNIETAAGSYSTSLSASMAKLESEVGKSLGEVTDRIDENLTKVAAAGGLLVKGLTIAPAAFKSLLGAVKGGATGIGKVMRDFGGGVAKFAGGWTPYLLAAGGAIGTLEDYIDDSYKTWQMLSTAGITLGGDLRRVGGIAGRTRLTFEELGGALAKASPALAKFGGMADLGTNTMVSMQEAMMDTVEGYKNSGQSYSKAMKMMGIAPQESMNLLTTLMEDQTFAAKLRGMQDGAEATRRAEITSEYIAQLDQLSKLTGKSREALAKEMAQKAQDAQFAATLMDMDKDQAAAAKAQLSFIENTYGKDASDVFKARLAGVVPTGDGARKIFATGLGSVLNEMADVTRNTAGPDAGGILKTFHDDLASEAERTRDMLKPLALAGGLVGSSFGNLFSATHEATLKNQALIETLGKNVTGMDRLAEAIDKAYNNVTGVEFRQGRERLGKSSLLERRIELETIADLAGTAVHRWLTEIGWGGGKYQALGAGGALNMMEAGMGAVVRGVDLFTPVEGPALNDGTQGEGRGRHNYGIRDFIERMYNSIMGPGAGGSNAELSEAISNNLGQVMLGDQGAEKMVVQALESQGMSKATINQTVENAMLTAGSAISGLSVQEIQNRRSAGVGDFGGDIKSVREVVSKYQNAATLSELDRQQKEAASYIVDPVVAKLDRIELAIKQNGISDQTVVSTDDNGKQPGANGKPTLAATTSEAIQISQVT